MPKFAFQKRQTLNTQLISHGDQNGLERSVLQNAKPDVFDLAARRSSKS